MANFKKLNKFDRLMAAITFAEAGDHETAIELMTDSRKKNRKRMIKRSDKRAQQRPLLRP